MFVKRKDWELQQLQTQNLRESVRRLDNKLLQQSYLIKNLMDELGYEVQHVKEHDRIVSKK